jgi:signal transduction histidine kinase/ligand-binding sensor domain-containing protein/DNA-binding response OmpR family regulator
VKRIITYFLFFCFATFSYSAVGYDLKPYAFHGLDVNDGLASNEVTCFLQDNFGFIWMGTTNGLCRYDGYELKSYKSNYLAPDFFTGNSIRCIAKDSKDRIFIGTTSGLNIFDQKTGHVKQYPISQMKCGIINAIAVTKDNVAYIGTAIGLLRFDERTGKFDNIRSDDKGGTIGGNYIQSLFLDSRNLLWIGMWHTGFCALDLNENRFYRIPQIVNKRFSVSSFFEDSDNNIWLSTWNEDGVYRLKNPLQKETFELTKYPIIYDNTSAISKPSIYCITQDKKMGYIWVGTSDGLKVITDPDDPNLVITYRNLNVGDAVSNEMPAMLVDRTGVLWFSMYGVGCYSLDLNKKNFSEYYFSELKQDKQIIPLTSIYKDENGLVWLGVKARNLILYDTKQGKAYPYYKDPVLRAISNQSNAIMSFARHSTRNELWLGTRYYGMYLVSLRNNRPVGVRHFDETLLKSPNTNKVVEGLNGYVWIATTQGVNYIEKEANGNYEFKSSKIINQALDRRCVNTLWYDQKQTLWIGTQDDGLFKVRLDHNGLPQGIAQYCMANGKINNNNISTLHCDSKNRFWIGTHGGGLSLYNPGKDRFDVVKNVKFLPDDAIHAIEEDQAGCLWLATGKGLVSYNYDLPSDRQIKVFSYKNNLGIKSFSAEASCKDRDGRLYFGGSNGLLWFSSNDFQDNTFSPTPQITDIYIANEPIQELAKRDSKIKLLPPFTRKIEVPYSRSIRIEFASLSFENSMSKSYAYKLNGVDNDWVYVKAKNRYAVYNNLKHGTYTFQVKTYNEDGYTNNKCASLVIVMEPAPWETIWAYMAYAAIVGGLIYLVFRIVINRMNFNKILEIEHLNRINSEEVNQAKLQFFTNISHELFTPITVLSCSLDDLATQSPKDLSLIHIMRMNLDRLMRLLQQILEFRKAETGNLKLKVSQGNIAGFVNEICEMSFVPLLKNKQLRFHFHAEPEVIIGYFDPDKLDKIMYNLLSNAYKYNIIGGEISVDLSKRKIGESDYIFIRVKDTGQGIEPQKIGQLFKRFYEGDYRKFKTKGTGIGLSLTKDLVKLHNGTIEVESVLEKGTEFTVKLPISDSSYCEGQIEQKNEPMVSISKITNGHENNCYKAKEETNGITVLMVEDHKDLLVVMQNILSRDFEVFTAVDGKEALKILEENDIDIVVTDYVMPEMDGIELTQFMKKEVKFSHIPIILLTAKQNTSDKVIGFEAGADVYITKPFEMESLLANIKSLVRNRRDISASFSGKDNIRLSQFTYNSVDKEFLEKAINIVEERIKSDDFNAADFYQAMNMSQPTLYRKIKSITNLSPNEFIRNVRFKLACKLLVERKLTITEVAYELGFSDSRYFSTVFKKEIGMSPSEYIRIYRKD